MLTFLPEPRGEIAITKDVLYGISLEFFGVKPAVFLKYELGMEINRAID